MCVKSPLQKTNDPSFISVSSFCLYTTTHSLTFSPLLPSISPSPLSPLLSPALPFPPPLPPFPPLSLPPLSPSPNLPSLPPLSLSLLSPSQTDSGCEGVGYHQQNSGEGGGGGGGGGGGKEKKRWGRRKHDKRNKDTSATAPVSYMPVYHYSITRNEGKSTKPR